MLNTFLTAQLRETLSFLHGKEDFFSGNEAARKKELSKLKWPASFTAYMAETKEKDFLEDVALALEFAEGRHPDGLKKSGMFTAFMSFLTSELPAHMDGTELALEKALQASLEQLFKVRTHQEIDNEIQTLSTKVFGAPYILVQMPRQAKAELKAEIRNKLSEKKPHAYPVFQINRKLIGGLRILEDGQVHDYSWLGRALHFTSLT